MTDAGWSKRLQTIGDAAILGRAFVKNWALAGRMVLSRGPLEMRRRINRFAWLKTVAASPNDLPARFTKGRHGLYREAVAYLTSEAAGTFITSIDEHFRHPERSILHEDLIPSELFAGMGLTPWMAELLGIMVPLLSPSLGESYIDAAENAGIPPDTCSLPKVTLGLALSDDLPPPVAMVSCNMPCDGGMNSYTLMQKKYGVPAFRLDIPYNFYSERAEDYFVGELKRLIAWLETNTKGRMDWDRMREVCEERNRAVELETELWDLISRRPAPMAAEPVYFSHLLYMCAFPGRPESTAVFRKIVEITKKIAASGRGALENEKYRTVLWNPPTLSCADLWVWAEAEFGVANIMDMLTYNRQPFIDTKSPETMLKGLARIIMQGPMARHTRGPAENFFSDLFSLYERFDLDMIWMAGHIGCKNTMALNGMFREKCRKRGIPLLIINYDLADRRIVPPSEVREQVSRFMETVARRS